MPLELKKFNLAELDFSNKKIIFLGKRNSGISFLLKELYIEEYYKNKN